MKKTLIYMLFLAVLAAGCSRSLIPEVEPEIVVEGWICQGENPVVILTGTVPVSTRPQALEDLVNYVITTAKVKITCEGRTYELKGSLDMDYFPPYVYTCKELKGEIGKTYKLHVEFKDKTAVSSATIPPPGRLENISAEAADNQGHYNILADLPDQPQTKDYYKLFILRESRDGSFKASMFGMFDDETFSGKTQRVHVANCLEHYLTKYVPYFDSTEVVQIRLSTMGAALYDYWKDYEEVTSLSKNPIFPAFTRIRSNIQGGFGYWAAYGSTYYRADIRELIKTGPATQMTEPLK